MKTIIIILTMFPLLGIGQNVSINNTGQAPSAAAAVLDLSSAFTTNSCSQQQIDAFQDRSVQKLKDFYNYLTIISNPKLDKRLRENSKNQAKQLFYGVDCKVDGKLAADFIDSCYNIASQVEWKALNIAISKNMVPQAKDSATGKYQGEIAFKESINGAVSRQKRAEIVLSKSEKQFGETKQEVWTVFICSIE